MSKFIINCIKFNHPVYIQWTCFMKKNNYFQKCNEKMKKKHHPRNILFMYHIIKSFKTLCLHLIHVSHFRFAIGRAMLKFQLERKARPACRGRYNSMFWKSFLDLSRKFLHTATLSVRYMAESRHERAADLEYGYGTHGDGVSSGECRSQWKVKHSGTLN